jgi:S1-C subfamily serine protease
MNKIARFHRGRLAIAVALLAAIAAGANAHVLADATELSVTLLDGKRVAATLVGTDPSVSSLGRNVAEGNGVTLTSAIQTSAAINPGNSGGALVDLSGHAIPSNEVKNVAARILSAQ